MKKKIIGYAGLDHLGLNSLAAGVTKGYIAVGYHNNFYKISDLKKGKISVNEPGLKRTLSKYHKNIKFSSNPKSLSQCEIVYISLDVPTDLYGNSNLKPVKKIIREVKKTLNKKAIMIILSQVPPGFTRKVNWVKKKLFYQVETLIFGDALKRAIYPERMIIGCADPDSPIDKNLRNFLNKFNCPILSMKYESAELAKISINACLASSVTITNTLAELCEQIGADWSEIVPALKMDKRIGKYAYLKPGLGISGGNLERDLNNIKRLSNKYKTDDKTIEAMTLNSRHRKKWAWEQLNKLVLKNKRKPKICILGLSYKENTISLKNAPSIALLSKLKKHNVSVFDPAVPKNALRHPFYHANSSLEALDKSDVLIILSPWKEFHFLRTKNLKKNMRGKVIIDPFRVLNERELIKYGFTYSTLGKSTISIRR